MEQVTENVFVETGFRGSNLGFVVTSEGVVLIDCPLDLYNAMKWAKEIGKWGKIRYIINTEQHLDHWINNSFFGGEIISHEAAREVMVKMDVKFIRERIKVQYSDPVPTISDDHQLRRPNITFSEHMTLYLGKHTFQIIYTPGHTIGQAAVYIPEEKVVFTGDNVSGEKRTATHNAYLDKWLESLRNLEKLDFNLIVPGHGKVCDKKYLDVQTKIIQRLLESTQKTEGWTIDEAVKRDIDPFYNTRDIGLKI